MRKLSITWKITIIYLIVAVPLIATLAVSYFSWYKGQSNRVLAQRVEVANLVGESFALKIKEICRSMSFLGSEIIDHRYSRSQAISALSELQSLYPAKFAVLTDKTGTVMVSTDSRFAGRNLSGNPAFTGIINDNKPTGIAPTERVYGTVGFFTAQAIRNDGQLQGIVASFIEVSRLSVVLPVKVRMGTANIVDSNGRLVYQSEYPNLTRANPYWGKYKFVRTALSGNTATSKDWIFPGDERKHFVSEIPIEGLGWAAGSSIKSNVALAPTKKAAIRLNIAVALVSLITLFFSIHFARKIVGSLMILVDRSRAIGDGYFDEPVVLDTGDEIEAVAYSLNKTRLNLKLKVEELKRSRDEMERRVEERTAELLNAAGRMRSLLESTSEGIYGTDVNGKCVFFNKSASNMTGFTSEEIHEKVVHDVIHSKHSDGSFYAMKDCIIEQTLVTGESIRNSTEFFWRKDGTSFPVEYSASPIVEDGTIRGVVVAFTDITERKRAEEFSCAIDEINAAIGSTLNIDEIMKMVVSETAKVFGAESGAILMRVDDSWVAKYGYGVLEDIIDSEFAGGEIKHVIDAVKNGEVLVVGEIDKKKQSITKIGMIAVRYNIKSCACIPLLAKDNLVGILVIAYHKAPVPFIKNQFDFIKKLVLSMSLALENARLYEIERDIADILQEALLVLPKKITGVDYDYLYRSATVAAKVGGDFFDLFELEHNRIGIVIGDVSGKGIEASTLTSTMKNTLRAYAYEEDSAAAIIMKTNEIISRTSPPGLFITIFFGILDIDTGGLVYCNAGHPAPVIIRKTSECTLLGANSPVVGAFPKLTFLDESTSILENEILLLYTDGVIEARCADGFLGEDRLVEVIEQAKPISVRELPNLIFNQVTGCTGGSLSDDIAILAICRQAY